VFFLPRVEKTDNKINNNVGGWRAVPNCALTVRSQNDDNRTKSALKIHPTKKAIPLITNNNR
jgi:hypothetical protein